MHPIATMILVTHFRPGCPSIYASDQSHCATISEIPACIGCITISRPQDRGLISCHLSLRRLCSFCSTRPHPHIQLLLVWSLRILTMSDCFSSRCMQTTGSRMRVAKLDWPGTFVFRSHTVSSSTSIHSLAVVVGAPYRCRWCSHGVCGGSQCNTSRPACNISCTVLTSCYRALDGDHQYPQSLSTRIDISFCHACHHPFDDGGQVFT